MCSSFLSFNDFATNVEEEEQQQQRKSEDDLVQVRGKRLIQQSANICALASRPGAQRRAEYYFGIRVV